MEEQHDGTVKVGQLQWNTSSEIVMVEQWWWKIDDGTVMLEK